MKIRLLITTLLFGVLLLLAGVCTAQSLTFSEVKVVSSSDGLITVPANKVWKIVNVNGGQGQITVTGAASNHCGTTCTGGSCGSSSCKYIGYIWELNGVVMDAVDGCYNCGGGTCYTSINNCPPNYTFAVGSLPNIQTPFWLKTGNTLQVNASNVFFSILEFNIVP